MKKSCVYIEWRLPGKPGGACSSGYVCNKTKKGLYILSSCHQLDYFVVNKDYETFKTTEVWRDVDVKIIVYDCKTFFRGKLLAFSRVPDLTLSFFALTDKVLSSFPMTNIQPAYLSTNEIYPRQTCYSIHNPTMVDQSMLAKFHFFQETMGHIVEPHFLYIYEEARIHYEIDLIMAGSSGAPIFDLNSHKVLGIVCGNLINTTFEGAAPAIRHYGVSVESIKAFLLHNQKLIV